MKEARKQRWNKIVAADDLPACAILLLGQFVRDYPDVAVAWYKLGQTLTDLSRFDEALAALERSKDLATPRAWLFVCCAIGNLFRERGEFSIAEQWYRRAIEEHPTDTQGYILLGGMFARVGRLSEAEELHRQATHCTEGCLVEAYHNLGLVLRATQRFDEAQLCFERALELDPQYKAARMAMRDVKRAIRIRGSPAAGV